MALVDSTGACPWLQSKPPAQKNPGVGVLQLASDTQSEPFRDISCGQASLEFGAVGDSNAADQR